MQKFKKLQFNQGTSSYTSIYAYVVKIECDDYCANHYIVRVLPSYEEALAFVKKTFFGKNEPKALRTSDNTWTITNLSGDAKAFDIEVRYTDTNFGTETFDVRNIEIYVDTSNFIMNEHGLIAQIGDFNFPDACISIND